MRLLALSLVALAATSCPAPAAAEEGVEFSANVGVVSDYRFRGLSLSDRNPALQGGVDVEAGMGLFAGGWASTIDDDGTNVELDLYGGYAGSAAGFDYRLTANAYFYPGGSGVDYMELRVEAERELGPVTLGAEAAFVPQQRNIDVANYYLGASAGVEIPGVSGLTATARGGWEQGFYDGKWDWELGVSYTRGALTASLAYVDSNYGGAAEEGRLGRAGLVASLLATF
jgi:uncharacterized protein (TIGR02001 family)